MCRSVLSDSIKEAIHKRQTSVYCLPDNAQRIEVHEIDTRKEKELASLYLVIFAL